MSRTSKRRFARLLVRSGEEEGYSIGSRLHESYGSGFTLREEVASGAQGASGHLTILATLAESTLSPERREVEVVCIRPGLSKNGNYWGADVLRSIVPLFEGARAFADHPGPGDRPERSVRDLIGYYKEPRIGEAGELRSTLRFTKTGNWLWELVQEALEDGRADVVGISIDADARVRAGEVDGRRARMVEAVTRLNSCDVVTRASAGGGFARLMQADSGSWWDHYEPPNEATAELLDVGVASGLPLRDQQVGVVPDGGTVDPVQAGPTAAQAIPGGVVMAGGQVVTERRSVNEAQGEGGVGGYVASETRGSDDGRGAAGAGAAPAAGAPGAAPVGQPVGVTETQGAPVAGPAAAPPPAGQDGGAGAGGASGGAGAVAGGEDWRWTARAREQAEQALREAQQEVERTKRMLECERSLQREMAQAGAALPQPIRTKLERQFSGKVFEAEELTGAIAEERRILAELTDSGLIRGVGYEKDIRVGMTEGERLQKAFDQLFEIYEGPNVPQLSGIREAYVAATHDSEISGITRPEVLREADVSTASFSYLLGTSMNKRLLKDYQAWPSEWQKFCTITPIKDFKQQDRIRLGAFGSLSTVPEDTAYSTLTLSDTRATYTPTKRGNLVAVTRETIVNDDLYAIKQIPGKLAVSAAFTLSEFVYTFLTSTGNIYDANPLFQNATGHTNSSVTNSGTVNTGIALSSNAMQTGVTAMRRQTNLASKPIGLKPRFLIVPPELEWTAMVITKSAGAPGANYNDVNPMLGYAEVLVVPQLSSTTGWYLAADPRVIDTIEVGFVGGQVNPILFVQDQPLYGNNFTNDVITYKVRHEYGGAVVDYRGFYQGNN